MTHAQRLSIREVDASAYQAMMPLEKYVRAGGLEPSVLELVKIRASQINHCAWCLQMHIRDARKEGVEQPKLDLVAAWEEAPDVFTAREQAALALTEQVTLISEAGVSDEVWNRVRAVFSETETVTLIMAIGAINVWNRMNVTVRTTLPPAVN